MQRVLDASRSCPTLQSLINTASERVAELPEYEPPDDSAARFVGSGVAYPELVATSSRFATSADEEES